MITIFCIRPKGFNIGNDVIFMGLQYFLNEAFGEVVNVISLPATSRYESQAKAGLTSKTIYEINQYGHGVIIGGGNLYENGELDVNLDALETLEVPLMLFSLSKGRIYNRQYNLVNRTDSMPPRVIEALHRKASCSLARDFATNDYLHSINCGQSKVGGCPTIFLDRIIPYISRMPIENDSGILISIRNPHLMSVPLEKQHQVYSDIRAIIRFLKTQGENKIRLLCHDHRDISFAASIPDIDYLYTGDVYTFLALLRSCKLNITYRLHSTLPCLSFGRPVINISYDQRALSLIETIGFDKWNINMVCSESVVDQVINRFHRISDLPNLRVQSESRWHELYTTMFNAFCQFAAEVFEYRDLVCIG